MCATALEIRSLVQVYFVRLTASVSRLGWGRGLAAETEKTPSRTKSRNNAVRTPSRLHAVLDGGNCSRARHFDLTFKKQLRQHGFESPERPCAASADEQERTCCATKHLKRRPDNLKYYSFYIQRRLKCTTTGARLHALRADFKPFVPPPNGWR